jgi:hypothetical protein
MCGVTDVGDAMLTEVLKEIGDVVLKYDAYAGYLIVLLWEGVVWYAIVMI